MSDASPEQLNGPTITVAICTHNGATRLPRTLDAIARQELNDGRWRVVVVDNASSDDSASVASASWSRRDVRFSVVVEPKVGLSHARWRAIDETSTDLVCFVDDDNLLEPNYLDLAVEVMGSEERIAVLGGRGVADFEREPPTWFSQYESMFAVGPQSEESGPVNRGWVYGAGMVLRTEALRAAGVRPDVQVLADRTGSSLTSGGDVELCQRMIEAGWQVWYDERLAFRHVMPAGRLTWAYALRLAHGSGEGVGALVGSALTPWGKSQALAHQLRKVIREYARVGFRPSTSEGEPAAIAARSSLGMLVGLSRQLGRSSPTQDEAVRS